MQSGLLFGALPQLASHASRSDGENEDTIILEPDRDGALAPASATHVQAGRATRAQFEIARGSGSASRPLRGSHVRLLRGPPQELAALVRAVFRGILAVAGFVASPQPGRLAMTAPARSKTAVGHASWSSGGRPELWKAQVFPWPWCDRRGARGLPVRLDRAIRK